MHATIGLDLLINNGNTKCMHAASIRYMVMHHCLSQCTARTLWLLQVSKHSLRCTHSSRNVLPIRSTIYILRVNRTRYRAKPNVSPPGCTTSCLLPAKHMYQYQQFDCHGNTPSGIETSDVKTVFSKTGNRLVKTRFLLVTRLRDVISRVWSVVWDVT